MLENKSIYIPQQAAMTKQENMGVHTKDSPTPRTAFLSKISK